MTDAERLQKAGYRLYSRHRVGCVLTVKWYHPTRPLIVTQDEAIALLRQKARAKKATKGRLGKAR